MVVAVLILACSGVAEAAKYSRVIKCEQKTRQDCPGATGGGAVLGAGAGAVAGKVLLRSHPIGWIAGAVIGGGAGHAVEKRSGCVNVAYYEVTLKNGTVFESATPYRYGEKIEIDD